MTKAVQKMLSILRSQEYKSARRNGFDISELVKDKSRYEREAVWFTETLKAEEPYILENDIFGFNRTVKDRPHFKLPDGTESWAWVEGNITPNYYFAIKNGFSAIFNKISSAKNSLDNEKQDYLSLLENNLKATLELCERYKQKALELGNDKLYNALEKIPFNGAETLYEALLFQKIIIFMLRCSGACHLTLGRFDQYMYEFYLNDLKNGADKDELLELIELYFISLNFDTDLYEGFQFGDNGQSMVLGGYDKDGNDMYNELSELCMNSSLELNIIDPKINLRVNKTTPIERYEFATKLTKNGLGFPQYCNDDIVVPALVKSGYDLEDALEYAVAACWEYIIPNCGRDIPNETTFNAPLVISNTVHKHLLNCNTFPEFLEKFKEETNKEVDSLVSRERYLDFSPSLSIFVDGCIEKGQDLSEYVAKYNNSGCLGAGIANAADSLAAIKKVIYEEKSISAQELIDALNNDFVGYEELQNKLLSCDKMGNNIDYVDSLADYVLNCYSTAINGRPNNRGGIWRAGTGSAQGYIIHSCYCPATPDGRKSGAPYGSSFSPAITTKLNGPLSVIKSFTKYDLTNFANGGPLTMELHDTVFRNIEGEKKVALLVKLFVDNGGHQLQLNSINRDRLIEAQKHPEEHKNLIVRVWGWSGYFCELDKSFQDHIIARTEFQV